MDSFMRKINRSTFVCDLSSVDKVTVGSNVRDMHTHLVYVWAKMFKTETILHVDAIFGVNGENHAIELFVSLDR